MVKGQRQGQYVGVRVDVLAGELCQPGQGNGNDERGEYKQIGREYPARHTQVGRIPKFDNGHVELARQAQDGHHGQHQLDSKTFR